MTLFDTAAFFLSALFGYCNHRYLHLPRPIGLVVLAMAPSVTIVVIDLILPPLQVGQVVGGALLQVGLPKTS